MVMERKEGEDDSQQQDGGIDANKEGIFLQDSENPDHNDDQAEEDRESGGQGDDPNVGIVPDWSLTCLILQDLVVDGDVEKGLDDGDDEAEEEDALDDQESPGPVLSLWSQPFG